MTATQVVLELVHPTGYNKKQSKYNNTIKQHLDGEPATGRITRQMQAQNEIANQSLFEIDDLTKLH